MTTQRKTATKAATNKVDPTSAILLEVAAERVSQTATYGEQRHPITPTGLGHLEAYGARANAWKDQCAANVAHGTPTWDAILQEEVYEALSEEDPARIRAELIQVAAVAVAIIESLDAKP